MSSLSAGLVRTATAVQGDASATRGTRTELMLCLVVSSDHYRTRLFDQAAEDQGWETILVVDPQEAFEIATRERLRLAIVDLQSATPATDEAYRRLVEWLSKKRQPLLIVCGKEDDLTSEIWSRQLGVWMYLPGVDDESDVALICGEARIVSEKLLEPITRSSGLPA